MVDELEMDTPLNDMLMEDNTEPVDIPQEEETLIDTSEDPQQATEAPEGAEAFDYLKATASKKARLTKRPQSKWVLFLSEYRLQCGREHPDLGFADITKLLAEQYKHLSPEENERLEQLLAEKRAEWQQQQQEEQQAGGGGGEGGKEDKDKGKEYVPLYPLVSHPVLCGLSLCSVPCVPAFPPPGGVVGTVCLWGPCLGTAATNAL